MGMAVNSGQTGVWGTVATCWGLSPPLHSPACLVRGLWDSPRSLPGSQ